jgi:hypothetical protein
MARSKEVNPSPLNMDYYDVQWVTYYEGDIFERFFCDTLKGRVSRDLEVF